MIVRCQLCLVLVLVSCAADGDGDTTAAGTAGTGATSATDATAATGASGDPGESEGAAAESSTGGVDPSAGTSVTDPDSGGSSDGVATSDSTGAAPTTGPGVLPGEGGLEAFCRRYVECGGTYYADEQACLDASYGYWGDCASRAAALDAFGACMSEIECSDWSPDAYNPASTPCAEQWQDLGASEPC